VNPVAPACIASAAFEPSIVMVTGSRVGPSEGRPGQLTEPAHADGLHVFGDGNPLPVPELANVEVAGASVDVRNALPTKENVAGGLHEPLTLDDAASVVLVGGAPEVRLEHRRLGFLDLEDEWVVGAAAVQQRDPTTGPDAADPHHLARRVRQREPFEEMADVVGEARPVPVEQRLRPVELVIAGDMTHQRKLIDDPTTTVDDLGELVHGLQVVVRVRPRDGLVDAPSGSGVADRRCHRRDPVRIDAPVPGVKGGRCRQASQQACVAQRHAQDRGLADVVRQAL